MRGRRIEGCEGACVPGHSLRDFESAAVRFEERQAAAVAAEEAAERKQRDREEEEEAAANARRARRAAETKAQRTKEKGEFTVRCAFLYRALIR